MTGRQPAPPHDRALVVGLAVVALVPLGLVPGVPGGLRLAVQLLVACLLPGAALVCHLRPGGASTTWALVVLASLVSYSGATVVMVWSSWWHPDAFLIGLVWLCLASFALRVLQLRRPRPELPGLSRTSTTS